MRYEDFILQLRPGRQGAYDVRVQSPAGEARGSFAIPFDPAELEFLEAGLWRGLDGEEETAGEEEEEVAHRDVAGTGGAARPDPREIGARLFRALFSGDILSRFHENLGRLQDRPKRGLRIRLQLDPTEQDMAGLYELPWELLYRQERDDFLGLDPQTPIVRYLEAGRPVRSASLPVPCRVLVVASKAGRRRLNLEREVESLRQALSQPGIEAEFLERATQNALYEALGGRSFHVVHFMGHADFEAGAGRGVFLFEDEEGAAHPVSGRALAVDLKRFKELRLVVLNSCHTAEAVGEAGLQAFSGVATALVMGGVPAVVAMQSRIADPAAIAFSRPFYQALGRGLALEEAMAEGRLAIHRRDETSLQWAVPVLFLRGEIRPLRRWMAYLGWSAPLLLALGLAAGLGPTLLRRWTAAGELRLVVDDFAVSATSSFAAGERGAAPGWERTKEILEQKLSAVRSRPRLRIVCLDCPQVTGRMKERLRVDYTLRGSVQEADRTRLNVALYDRDLVLEPPAVVVEGEAGGTGGKERQVLALQGRLAEAILERLGVRLDAASAAALRRLPTASGEALERNNQGVALALQGRDREAREAYLAALRLDPSYAAAYSNLAHLEAAQGEAQAALRHYRAAVERLPGYAVFHYNLGNFLALEGRDREALASLRRAVELDPAYVQAHNELGNVYLHLARPQEARRELEEGLEIDPAFAPLHKNLGRTALAEGQAAEAARHLEEALRRYAAEDRWGRAEATWWLAAAQDRMEPRGDACRTLERFRELDAAGISDWADDAQRLGQELQCQRAP